MSAKADMLIVAGVAIALMAGAWYVKKKIEGVGNTLVDAAQAGLSAWDEFDSGQWVADKIKLAADVQTYEEKYPIYQDPVTGTYQRSPDILIHPAPVDSRMFD